MVELGTYTQSSYFSKAYCLLAYGHANMLICLKLDKAPICKQNAILFYIIYNNVDRLLQTSLYLVFFFCSLLHKSIHSTYPNLHISQFLGTL